MRGLLHVVLNRSMNGGMRAVERLQGPSAQQGLIEQIFVVSAGRRQAFDLAVMPAIDRAQRLTAAPPLRDFGKNVDPRPHVLAPFSVVRGGGRRATSAARTGVAVFALKIVDGAGAARRVAAHLVQRAQWKVTIKGRVFDSLGHQRAGDLLEAADEQAPVPGGPHHRARAAAPREARCG